MTSDVLGQSLLLGSPVLKPHLDHPHVEPGLGAQSLAHLSSRFGAVAVGALQSVQLLTADRRTSSLAAAFGAAAHIFHLRDTAVCTQVCTSPGR